MVTIINTQLRLWRGQRNCWFQRGNEVWSLLWSSCALWNHILWMRTLMLAILWHFISFFDNIKIITASRGHLQIKCNNGRNELFALMIFGSLAPYYTNWRHAPRAPVEYFLAVSSSQLPLSDFRTARKGLRVNTSKGMREVWLNGRKGRVGFWSSDSLLFSLISWKMRVGMRVQTTSLALLLTHNLWVDINIVEIAHNENNSFFVSKIILLLLRWQSNKPWIFWSDHAVIAKNNCPLEDQMCMVSSAEGRATALQGLKGLS